MEILEKVKSRLPKELIGRIELEGSEIVIYTKDRDFFVTHGDTVRTIVEELKKRIEVRPEGNLCLDQKSAEKRVLEIVPEDAKIKHIHFEPERSLMIIAAEKPGIVIGKGGETFRQIKAETLWVPRIERVPPIKSDIIEGIRGILHREVKYRKKFLNQIGESIFTDRDTKRDWIRIIGLGGWREVGRSCTFVETPKSKVIIDCGVNVGATGSDMYPYLNVKEFDPAELDAIIVSHAHLDHIGCIPYLYEYGYKGPLYLTTPTLDLFALLCFDFIDVMQRSGVKPLFTAKGVKEAVKHSITLEYGEVSDVAPDVRLTFWNAGHILGSSLVHLHIGEGLHNIVYASDMKYGWTTLLPPANTNFQRIETLIIESTYGSPEDVMPRREDAEKQLIDVINRTMERGGRVLIPSFSVERAQDVMEILVENNFQYPVFIDGMIWDANGIYTAYPEYMTKSIQRKIFAGQDPFMNNIFRRIASVSDREKAWEEKPSVIISTSGMLVGGPAMEHLKTLAEDPNNTLVFVGFQGEGTLGRRIQKGWKEIPSSTEDGKTFTINLAMDVQTVEGLSGHSDRNQLLSFVGSLAPKLSKVVVVHGENQKAVNLARTIHKLFRLETVAPKNLEAIRLK